MIKYVLILLLFDFGQLNIEDPNGQAWVSHFDTKELCFEAMARVPEPSNPKIEWYSVICAEFNFINTRVISAGGLPGAWF